MGFLFGGGTPRPAAPPPAPVVSDVEKAKKKKKTAALALKFTGKRGLTEETNVGRKQLV